MSDHSAIEWTDATWNPVTGCDRVSPGCAHCYALDLAARLKAMGNPRYRRDGDPGTSGPGFGVTLHPDKLSEPYRWKQPRRVFVNSMSDLFHEDIPDEYIQRVFGVMADNQRHTFQVLTKRPERMRDFMRGFELWWNYADPTHRAPLANVWLGTSVENQYWADVRVPVLVDTRAAVRFLSCEPLLGPVNILRWVGTGDIVREHGSTGKVVFRERAGIAWVIVGGESGPAHRPMDVDWVRSLRDQSAFAAFFFKQWGGRTPKSGGRELDGRTWDEMPALPALSDAIAGAPENQKGPSVSPSQKHMRGNG